MGLPSLVAAHAQRVASSGSAQLLAEATGICNETLLALARRAVRPSGEVDRPGRVVSERAELLAVLAREPVANGP